MTGFLIGKTADGRAQNLDLRFANRHGLIAGATGTGKTVSLQVLAEGFSKAGVPVFLADVKGDLSGICAPSAAQDFILKRVAKLGLTDHTPEAMPSIFWDVFGVSGHPLRATVSDMGPLLLARILDLNDTQEGVLTVAFALADAEGLLLLDLKDLQALLSDMSDRVSDVSATYGNVTPASLAAIQRKLLQLDQQGADAFLGEPALDLSDLMRSKGQRGVISVLAADKLIQAPRLYATFLLWLLSELFEQLPEAGDVPQPKLVFFFDEAHLLFTDAPKALLQKIEQVVRLIRSKGVGIYFVTQSPTDVPEDILAQLGCRVQHALRAFTPQAQKAVKVAAQTFRANPNLDTETVLTELGIGEALVSTLTDGGVPSMVERVWVAPPLSRVGPAEPAQKAEAQRISPVAGVYEAVQDRASAFESLKARAEKAAQSAEDAQRTARGSRDNTPARGASRQGVGEALVKSVVRSVGSQIGRAIIRGVLGSLRR